MYRHPRSFVSLALLVAAFPGCLSGQSDSESDPAEADQAIMNGTQIAEANSGIVKVVMGSSTCSGVLLTNSWILTSRACVDDPSVHADPSLLQLSMGTETVGAGEVILHQDRDVALVRAVSAFTMNGSLTGYELPTSNGTAGGPTVTCKGYGRPTFNGNTGVLRTGTANLAGNTLTPAGSGSVGMPHYGDMGGACFVSLPDGRSLPAAIVSSCATSGQNVTSCNVVRTHDVRGWIAETRTVKELVATNSGKCVEIPGFSFTAGAGAAQRSCNSLWSQKWRFDYAGMGSSIWYRIRAKHDGYCLTAPSSASGAQLVQQPCSLANNSQLFRFVEQGSGHAINTWTGLCVDIRSASTSDGGVVQQHTCNAASNQTFDIRTQVEEGSVEINNLGSLKCADVPNADLGEENMKQFSCNMGANQRFRFEQVAGFMAGVSLIHPVHSGLCVDVEGNTPTLGVPIQQWSSCNGGSNQLFRLRYGNGGQYKLVTTFGHCAEVGAGDWITQQACSSSTSSLQRTWFLTQ